MKRSIGTRSRRIVAAFVVLAAMTLGAGSISRAEGPPTDAGGESDMASVWTPPTSLYAVSLAAPHAGQRWTQVGEGWTTWFDKTPASGISSVGGSARFGNDIVFSSTEPAGDESTDAEVYLRHTDGTVEQLTDNTSLIGENGEATPIDDLDPIFSPDGTKIAFTSAPAPATTEEGGEEGGGAGGGSDTGGGRPPVSGQAATQIWVLDLEKPADDPARLQQVTFSAAADGPSAQPAWSPDGQQIAFARGSGQKAHIMILDLTKPWGTEGRERTISTGRHFGHPSWSPTDPNAIAVTMGAGVMADVYVINLTDGSLRPLAATDNVAEAYPAFSPDGRYVAYQRGDDAIGGAIWVTPVDAAVGELVVGPDATTPLWSDRNPGWLDNDTIVYDSTKGARPAADLGVAMTGDPASVAVGGTVAYSIDVTNYGPLPAPGVKVVATLPPGLTSPTATASWAAAVHGSPGSEQGGGGGETGGGDEGGGDDVTPPAPAVTVTGGVVAVEFGTFAKGDKLAVGATVRIVARAGAAGSHHVTAVVSMTPVADSDDPYVHDIYDPVETNDATAVDTTATASVAAGSGVVTTTVVTGVAAPSEEPRSPVVVNGLRCTIVGSGGSDVLTGSYGRDIICGLGGNDVINALGGNDVVFGGAGNDVIAGGAGSDWLDGGAGADRINGGTGTDVEQGRAGNDTLTHESGISRFYGGLGNDWIVSVDRDRDWVNGGSGRDAAHVDARGDRVYGVEKLR